jgi:hypothetical protein
MTNVPRKVEPTKEVGSEGGGPGEVEVERERVPLGGSEAAETVDSTTSSPRVLRDRQSGEK